MFDINQYLNNNTTTNQNIPYNQINPNITMNNPGCGCNQQPVMQGPCCLQNKTFTQYVPQPCNYHTHTVNTVLRKRYIVPTYTNSEETVFVDENPCCNRNNRMF